MEYVSIYALIGLVLMIKDVVTTWSEEELEQLASLPFDNFTAFTYMMLVTLFCWPALLCGWRPPQLF